MKLMQDMNPERTYRGVTFPQGVAVELPADFPEDHAQHLHDWGWKKIEEAAPAASAPELVVEEEPSSEPVEAEETDLHTPKRGGRKPKA